MFMQAAFGPIGCRFPTPALSTANLSTCSLFSDVPQIRTIINTTVAILKFWFVTHMFT